MAGRKPIYATELDCFEAKIIKTPNCWKWNGAVALYGRGLFAWRGKTYQAHREAWRMYRGEIPADVCVLHHCDNPLCVNPGHLFLGTQADNLADMKAKGRDNRTGRKWTPSTIKEKIIEEMQGATNREIGKIASKYNLTVKSVLRIAGRWSPKKEAVIE